MSAPTAFRIYRIRRPGGRARRGSSRRSRTGRWGGVPEASGWRKASYRGSSEGGCVEVLDGHPAGVPVRGAPR
ncbi:DUF397 domain-containing protein [Streptomyces nigrescens]|uniref:DUF397 domain-containing protein n=1 Tax=Streptomyces nigrescens TaxID=1920 RepID=UPI002905659D|nr:DUF397 domain-containing protein [Streptomyces nigrescens]